MAESHVVAFLRILSAVAAIGSSLGCAGGQANSGRAASSASAAPSSGDEQPIPADLRVAVERAEQLGKEIYVEDKASAIGTDVLMARVKSIDDLGLGGYLTLREADESMHPKPSRSWARAEL